MSGRTALFSAGALAWVLLANGGCVSSNHEAAPLRPVTLPDLSGAADSVQQQLRARYESLTLKADNANTAPAILGNE